MKRDKRIYITPDANLGPVPVIDTDELQRTINERALLSEKERSALSQDAWGPFVRGEVETRPVIITVEDDA